jgi:hypothetical protein
MATLVREQAEAAEVRAERAERTLDAGGAPATPARPRVVEVGGSPEDEAAALRQTRVDLEAMRAALTRCGVAMISFFLARSRLYGESLIRGRKCSVQNSIAAPS